MANPFKRKIILNADDYGACKFINDGITDAVKANSINSVSCFVTLPRSEADIMELIELQKDHKFKIGLHFSITCGFPITLGKSMKPGPNKAFYEVHQHNYLKIDLDEFRTELRNQVNLLQAYLDRKGAGKVDHITVHHGVVYFFDRLFDVFKQVAKEFGIPVRSPLPWSKSDLSFYSYSQALPIKLEGAKNGAKIFWENLIHRKTRDKEVLKMLKGQALANIKLQIESMKGTIKHPVCFADTIYGQPFYENLMYLISQVPENNTVELMFHLGKGDPKEKLPAGINRGYFDYRMQELQAVKSLEILENADVLLTNYCDI